MRRTAVARGIGLVGAPVLIIALLSMHGLGNGTGADVGTPHGAEAGTDHGAPGDHDGCSDCLHHLLTSCIAVLTALVTWRTARARRARRPVSPTIAFGPDQPRRLALRALGRPPDRAWIRLGVMRC